MKVLPYSFYSRDTVSVAQDLLGKMLVFNNQGTDVGGIIVETEAYLGLEDEACHSARGKSKRNAVMFGPSGHAYLYLIYGIHLCFNVTTGAPDAPEAVLIRALEPVYGVDLMQKNRSKDDLLSLCSGPGKLVQALGMDISLNGVSVVESQVKIFNPQGQLKGLESGGQVSKVYGESGEKLDEKFGEGASTSNGAASLPNIVVTTRVGISKAADLPLRFYLEGNKYISKK